MAVRAWEQISWAARALVMVRLPPMIGSLWVSARSVKNRSLASRCMLIIATGVGLILVYLFVAISGPRVQRESPTGTYRMPLWPLPPLLVIGVMVYAACGLGRDSVSQLVVAAGTLGLGIVCYLIFPRPRAGRWVLPEPISGPRGDSDHNDSLITAVRVSNLE
ncbi:hypothetical protein GFY24_09925 [Nocardia sp. SYP-A9097]|nr:hypothetical protein [Nocardia sp. SYP-A9097]